MMARRFDRLGWAMDQTDLEPPERFVLLILADMANEQGECWPSYSTVAERTGYSKRGVQNFITSLGQKGRLTSSPRRGDNGRQTSNLYVLSFGEGGTTCQGEGFSGAMGGSTGCHDVEPANRTTQQGTRKNNSSTTSKSRSSQRASAHRGDEMDDPVDAVFDQEQDDSGPDTLNPRGGPDSAWGLNKHYRDSVRVAGNGFLGNTNDKAMRGFFAKAKREGVTPDVLRKMVDEFVTDERLFTKATGGARWRVFIANAEGLRQRVVIARSVGRVADFSKVPEFGGSIPQHILDEILAEAG